MLLVDKGFVSPFAVGTWKMSATVKIQNVVREATIFFIYDLDFIGNLNFLFGLFLHLSITTDICPSADGQSELKISEANVGAKAAKCTSASQ